MYTTSKEAELTRLALGCYADVLLAFFHPFFASVIDSYDSVLTCVVFFESDG